MVANRHELVQCLLMSENENLPENPLETEISKGAKEPVKTDTSVAAMKLLLLLAIVFALVKWGLPLMNGMADEFKKKQGDEQKDEKADEKADEKLTSDESENDEDKPVMIESNGEDKLRLAIEREINLWIKKQSPDSSATVKFVNVNDDQTKLAVEYEEKNAAGESESKELLFKKDEFGIYVYEDADGVRQIRVRQPK